MSAKFRGPPQPMRGPDPAAQMIQAKINQALSLQNMGRLDEAQAIYQDILKTYPKHFDSLHLSGLVAILKGDREGGIKLIDKAIKVNPNVAAAYNNRGNALLDLKRVDEALVSYNKALALKPDYASAHNNRGNVLQVLDRLGEAMASYEKAIALNPNLPDGHFNRGNVLKKLGRFEEAIACFDKALSLKPDYAEVYNNRGNAFLDLRRPSDALASYEKALRFKPDYKFLFGTYLNTKMMLCDWSSFPDNLKRYRDGILAGRRVSIPFPSLTLLDEPDLQMTVAKLYAEAEHPRRLSLGPARKRKPDGKIRIGYYSADFRNHAMTYLMAGLYEAHDTDRFEIYGFSLSRSAHDEMRERVSAAFHKFIDVKDKTDKQVAKLSRDLGIDIAVDLNGYTLGERLSIFAEGCAPVQVSFLGYPGTTGADYIDYVIADKTVMPAENQRYFTERVVYLPRTYQVNDAVRNISDKNFTRQELGLPETGFVFCCFNSNFKILPVTFDGWMRILKAVDGSVLWLIEDNEIAAANLRKEAESRGVEGGRLVFAKHVPVDVHLARYRQADLFLDSLPYNAHTTTSDALWVGVPVLTCIGQSFAARVAASLLNEVGLPELITSSQKEFEATAIDLARNAARLGEIKSKLAVKKATTRLFDSKSYARCLEAAYEAMYARSQAGLPPEMIEVQG